MTLKEIIRIVTEAHKRGLECEIKDAEELQAFIKGFNFAMKYGDWRSVEDELPLKGEFVLAVDEFDEISIARLNSEGDWHTDADYGLYNVKYWMARPEPPKDNDYE
jgi:hypothetical protein